MDKKTAYDIAKKSVIHWTIDKDGYRCATVTKDGDSRTVRRHILNFYLEHGWIPDYVDHIDNIQEMMTQVICGPQLLHRIVATPKNVQTTPVESKVFLGTHLDKSGEPE